jgi:hypothetical protein
VSRSVRDLLPQIDWSLRGSLVVVCYQKDQLRPKGSLEVVCYQKDQLRPKGSLVIGSNHLIMMVLALVMID